MARGAGYGKVGAYQRLAPGSYRVAARPAGAGADAKPLLEWTADIEKGGAYTVAAVGRGEQRKGTFFRDELTRPKPGAARVRLIQAASTAPTANVTTVGDLLIAADAAFGTATGYAEVPAGSWPLTAKAANSPLSAKRTVSVAAGSITSLLLLDGSDGRLVLTSVQDSAAGGSTPQGGVDTGGGGVVGADPFRGDQSAVLLVAAGVLAGGSALARRNTRGRRPAPAGPGRRSRTAVQTGG